jgi:hypothetical protein
LLFISVLPVQGSVLLRVTSVSALSTLSSETSETLLGERECAVGGGSHAAGGLCGTPQRSCSHSSQSRHRVRGRGAMVRHRTALSRPACGDAARASAACGRRCESSLGVNVPLSHVTSPACTAALLLFLQDARREGDCGGAQEWYAHANEPREHLRPPTFRTHAMHPPGFPSLIDFASSLHSTPQTSPFEASCILLTST